MLWSQCLITIFEKMCMVIVNYYAINQMNIFYRIRKRVRKFKPLSRETISSVLKIPCNDYTREVECFFRFEAMNCTYLYLK